MAAVFLLAQAARTYSDYWLGVWADGKYELNAGAYVAVFAGLVVGTLLLSTARIALFTWLAQHSARHLHKAMATHILRAPMLFFDQVSAASSHGRE